MIGLIDPRSKYESTVKLIPKENEKEAEITNE